MSYNTSIPFASSITYGPSSRSQRGVWVLVPRCTDTAMAVAGGLAPATRRVVAHMPMDPPPMVGVTVPQPRDKGTLPALATALLWLERECDNATVVVVGPEVKNTPEMVRALRRAVGMIRMDRNRITAVGSSSVVARDSVLRNALATWTPEWWWPLCEAMGHPSLIRAAYEEGQPADLLWSRWLRPPVRARHPLHLLEEVYPTPVLSKLVSA